MKTLTRYLVVLLLFFDGLAVTVGFSLAYLLRNVGPFRVYFDGVQPISVYLSALPIAIVFLWVIGYYYRLYPKEYSFDSFGELYRAIQSCVNWVLVIMATSYLVKYDYSRVIVILTFLFTLLWLSLFRALLQLALLRWRKNGVFAKRVLIVGRGKPAKYIARRLLNHDSLDYHIVGFLHQTLPENGDSMALGTYADFEKILAGHSVDEVYVVDQNLSHQQILSFMAKSRKNRVRFKVVSNLFRLVTDEVEIYDLNDIPTLDPARIENNWWNGFPKRLFDLFFSSLAILVCLPLFLIIGVIIFFDDGRPIIFAQKRVGEDKKIFRMFKFRTMKKGTSVYDEPPLNQDDPRLTRVGSWLRRNSLDELPQFFNVFRGNMSLVGPRPEMLFKTMDYDEWQNMRFLVKPGITGLWQILGRKDLPLAENIHYDFYYITHQSFLLDVTILLKTVPMVLTGRGAY